jgi:hypothetical protein
MRTFTNVDLEEDMDMPCLCDCGNWFDLNDGYGSLKPNKRNMVVCPKCHFHENNWHRKVEDLKEQIYELECSGKKPKTLIKLKKQL